MQTHTIMPAVQDSRERSGMSRLTAITTGAGLLLLPGLFLLLPHLNPATLQGAPSLAGALHPSPAHAVAVVSAAVQSAPPRAFHPVVTSEEQGVQVCRGARQEDALGQPVVLPVEAVIIADPALSGAWNPPPLVSCQYLLGRSITTAGARPNESPHSASVGVQLF